MGFNALDVLLGRTPPKGSLYWRLGADPRNNGWGSAEGQPESTFDGGPSDLSAMAAPRIEAVAAKTPDARTATAAGDLAVHGAVIEEVSVGPGALLRMGDGEIPVRAKDPDSLRGVVSDVEAIRPDTVGFSPVASVAKMLEHV